MRKTLTILIIFLACSGVWAQEVQEFIEGSISYVTSQNVYVRFETTDLINPGDTLFILKEGIYTPALVVINKSSISCICAEVPGYEAKISDPVRARTNPAKVPDQPVAADASPPVVIAPVTAEEEILKDSVAARPEQKITGRIAVSSYSNFSNSPAGNNQRMRYTFSLNARNIAHTRLSAESYISFSHSSEKWEYIQENIFNGLKIYSLALKYDFRKDATLLFGRKINPKLSSIGAIDGLQFEKRFRNISFGLIAGSRPDYADYSVNLSLMQFGAYLSHEFKKGPGQMQNTLAFVDQENSWETDRRFLYFQHNNTLLKNLYLFGSIEMDLYQKIDEQKSNTFNLTNFYLLVRYRVIKQLSLSLSYSARNNVIYYETYKDIVERLTETTTLQGVTFQANYRPLPKLSLGLKAGYRNRKEDPRPSMNGDVYATYSLIPVIKVSATVSATFLQTGYLDGRIFTAGISRDLLAGKLYCGLNYRHVNYSFAYNESSLSQNMAEVSLNWNVYKKLMLSVNYEGTFDDNYTYSRLYINLTQRF